MKLTYLCVLLLQFWSKFQLQAIAHFRHNMLSDHVQFMYLKSARSVRSIHSNVHLVPEDLDSSASIYKISSSNALQCIFDIVKLWKETHVIILYRSNADQKMLITKFVSRQRHINVELVKWQEDTISNHSYEIQHIQWNLRSVIVVCCEAFLAQEFLQMMSNTGSFASNRNILLVTEDYSPILKRFNFFITSQLSILIPEIRELPEMIDIHRVINFNVWDVFNNYGVKENFKINEQRFRKIHVMKWNLFKGLSPLDLFKSNANSRMEEKVIQAGLINFMPFALFNTSKGCTASNGYVVDIYEILANNLNFRMNFSCSALFTTGIQLANGTYTGVMKRIADKEIDVGINPMVMTAWRLKLTQIHHPLNRIRATAWFRTEQTSETFSSRTHFSAFSLDVWLVFTATFITVAFSVALVLKISPLKLNRNAPEIHPPCHKKIVRLLRWFVCGEFLEEVMEFAPGISTKMLIGTLNGMVTLIFLHYTSVFSSVLTSQTVALPFTNIEELVNNFNYRIGIQSSTGYQDLLQSSDDDLYKRIWQRMIEADDNFVPDIPTGLRKVCSAEKYTFFFDDQATAYGAAAREFHICGLNFMTFNILEDYLYSTIRHDFPYSKTFSNAIFRMKETGVLERVRTSYFSEKGTSITQVRSNAESGKYSNAIFAFELFHILIPIGILVSGIILSILVLILEITVNKLVRTSNPNPPLEVITRPDDLWKFN